MSFTQCKHGRCKDHKPVFETLRHRNVESRKAILEWCCWQRKIIVITIMDLQCKLCGREESQKKDCYRTICKCCGHEEIHFVNRCY